MCRGYFYSQEIDSHHATEHRSTDQSRNGCGMCCFCHAQPFEITRAKNIKNTLMQRSCQNAKVVEAFCSRRVHHRDRPQHTIPCTAGCHTSRDFVHWRFSDAGRRSAWIASSCRRPKTYTNPDSCTATKRGIYSITYRRTRARAHSGNPAFRRPSINSFKCDCLRRPILADIVKAGSVSSRRAAASRASPSRPR